MHTRDRLIALLFSSALAGAAIAQPSLHPGDILLARNTAGNRILTGLVDPDSGAPGYNRRVFLATFGEAPNFTNDPGLDSDVGAFPPFSGLGFTIRKALRVWQGGTFGVIPTERIQVRLGPLGPVLTPTDDTPVVGFSMSVNSEGQIHHHPGYTLLEPWGDGIYLYEAEVWSSVGSIAASRPVWIVFNQNRPLEEQITAGEWLVGNVYCPADFNTDEFVDGIDSDQFNNAFEAGDIEADFNSDGFVDGIDSDQFNNAFEQGC